MEKHAGKKLSRVLISLYHKDAIDMLLNVLNDLDVEIVSTGGTKAYISEKGYKVKSVEELTGYPSILGGRVKTMHPAIVGGILCQPDHENDQDEMLQYTISAFDMVVVDLYPFEIAAAGGASHHEIIENIDIGGITLIRAAAKNYDNVLVVPSVDYFNEIAELLRRQGGFSTLDDRRRMAAVAFQVSSHYDTMVFNYLNRGDIRVFKESISENLPLRYGENPHQQACYFGRLEEVFDQLGGKPLSYNNLLDVDAAIALMSEFPAPTFSIIKHTNPCGVATRDSIEEAWSEAIAGDPASAFGGIFISNREVDHDLALSINKIFFEVLLAPSFSDEAVGVFGEKKNRVLLKTKSFLTPDARFRSVLNGVLWQTTDYKSILPEQWKSATDRKPSPDEEKDLVFAGSIVKHLKSNAIALIKDSMLIGAGMGQTSRVDALQQALVKARKNGHSLDGAVMASDAFFPFPDCVEIAHKAGITAVLQPGGSIRDSDSIDYCNLAGMAMVMTGHRHFRH